MKQKENSNKNREYFMFEFSLYDGEHETIFNIIEVNTDKNEITCGVSYCGRLSRQSFDLLSDNNGLYFEYGIYYKKIYIDDFMDMEAVA